MIKAFLKFIKNNPYNVLSEKTDNRYSHYMDYKQFKFISNENISEFINKIFRFLFFEVQKDLFNQDSIKLLKVVNEEIASIEKIEEYIKTERVKLNWKDIKYNIDNKILKKYYTDVYKENIEAIDKDIKVKKLTKNILRDISIEISHINDKFALYTINKENEAFFPDYNAIRKMKSNKIYDIKDILIKKGDKLNKIKPEVLYFYGINFIDYEIKKIEDRIYLMDIEYYLNKQEINSKNNNNIRYENYKNEKNVFSVTGKIIIYNYNNIITLYALLDDEKTLYQFIR